MPGHGGAPSPVRPIVLCDVGANADCANPSTWCSSPRWAACMLKKILGYESPRAALLNIGEENTKGNALAQDAHGLMASA